MAGGSRQTRVQLDLRICLCCEHHQRWGSAEIGGSVCHEHYCRVRQTFLKIVGLIDIPQGCPYELEQILYMANVDYMPVSEAYYSGA